MRVWSRDRDTIIAASRERAGRVPDGPRVISWRWSKIIREAQ